MHMSYRRRMVAVAFVMVVATMAPANSQGQAAAGARREAGTAVKKPAVPVSMTECEGTNNCASWTFLGDQGNGQWPTGETANLHVDRYDDKSVVITRADSTGAKAGLTATYTGTRTGNRVGGEYVSSWPGHWVNQTGNWYGTVEKNPLPPPVMHFCAQNCFTLTLEDGHYVAKNDVGEPFAIWTILSFTQSSVMLRRTDTSGFGGVYAGQVAPGGGKLANQTFNGNADSAKLVWGPLLSTVPGTNAERDRVYGRPQQAPTFIVRSPVVVCVPWFFSVICN